MFKGIAADLNRRSPHYVSDWLVKDFKGIQKVASASIYMFFNSFAPAITFAMLLFNKTSHQIGVFEVLFATAIGGAIFSIFAGQPLVIVGVTGPITILTISMVELSQAWNINFLPFYAWAQLWAALMHAIISAYNLCDLIKHVTQFSCETFGFLISIIFIYEGLHSISKYFTNNTSGDMSAIYLELIIALSTVYLSLQLLKAEKWVFFTSFIRNGIVDYSITIAVIFCSSIAYFGDNADIPIEKLITPDRFGTTIPRPWLINLGDLPVWAVFVAIIPGFIITVLFVFDHNISSLMAQAKEYKLQKGVSFHYDFLVLGVCLIVTGVLGLPPISGMIPHSFLHTRSLIRQEVNSNSNANTVNDGDVETGLSVLENKIRERQVIREKLKNAKAHYKATNIRLVEYVASTDNDTSLKSKESGIFRQEDDSVGFSLTKFVGMHMTPERYNKKPVDAIDYYRNRIKELNAEIQELKQIDYVSDKNVPTRGFDNANNRAMETSSRDNKSNQHNKLKTEESKYFVDFEMIDTAEYTNETPNVSYPHSPLSLHTVDCNDDQVISPVSTDSQHQQRMSAETIEHIVYEQRISNLIQSLLIGMMCFAPFIGYLQCIPRCTMDGLFVVLGISGFQGNQFYYRIIYMLCDSTCRVQYANEVCHSPVSDIDSGNTIDIEVQVRGDTTSTSKKSSFLNSIPYQIVCLFTSLQLCACLIIFGLTFTPAVIMFPVLIGILVPFRLYLLPKCFEEEYLNMLDPLDL